MRFARLSAAALLAWLVAAPALAQQAPVQSQPLAPPAAQPAVGATPLTPPAPLAPPAPQFAAPPPDLTAREALTGAPVPPIKTEATLCVRPVVIDEEVKTWDHLQELGGAKPAWDAYMIGDYVGSVPIFARLAKVGHPEAERLMGVVYYFGQGVPQDYARSLYWFEKAANQGCFGAYAAVSSLYRDGKGAAADLGKAYMWLNIAVSRLPDSVERDALIKERGKVEALMTPGQIEAAQKRSQAFKEKPVVPPDPEDLPVDYFPKSLN
ncbi:tetratricopeptide repeat protein [Dongia sedimenti]|uniref:Tetratricopeptide repeat protein n=1 Tax=Dongia sedimenti TaxID=3064282 RepID=A0ABU0YRV8_9PROT|nr:tetratricopeptide repeat protein [Rhodospirillaceae bacterium R-7]